MWTRKLLVEKYKYKLCVFWLNHVVIWVKYSGFKHCNFCLFFFCKVNSIEIMSNKARHNLTDAKCRLCSERLELAVSFRELLGQTKVMQIRQRETQNHQRAITHEVCCLLSQYANSWWWILPQAIHSTCCYT